MKKGRKFEFRSRCTVPFDLPARMIRPMRKRGQLLYRVQELKDGEYVDVMTTGNENKAISKLAEMFGYDIEDFNEVTTHE